MSTLTAYADSSNVTHTISVQSNTGGNIVSSGGIVREGAQTAKVDITTVVDGKILVDIHEQSDGEPLIIKYSTTTKDASTVAVTDVRLNTATTADQKIPRYVPDDTYDIRTDATTLEREVSHNATSAIEKSITSNITNITDGNTEKMIVHEEAVTSPPSFLARIADTVTRTIHYVLSTLFSYRTHST